MCRTQPTKATQAPGKVSRQPGDQWNGKDEKGDDPGKQEDQRLELGSKIDERIGGGGDGALDHCAELLADDGDSARVGADVRGS